MLSCRTFYFRNVILFRIFFIFFYILVILNLVNLIPVVVRLCEFALATILFSELFIKIINKIKIKKKSCALHIDMWYCINKDSSIEAPPGHHTQLEDGMYMFSLMRGCQSMNT